MTTRQHLALLAACIAVAACGSPKPYGPLPTDAQVAWQRMEINMFCHFGPNTFSGAEWGSGEEEESLFAPRALDCQQWAAVAEQAGMGGIIVTAKHHDGFCLWPSSQSSHSVAQSSWREGNGDVLRELRQAIDAHPRLKMGVYISPWDRNHQAYGSEAYNGVFDSTLREVHEAYGPMFEQWFDGACGEGPTGRRQSYDWPRFMRTMQQVAPQAVVFSDVGPGCRWVGNEEGRASTTCHSTLRIAGATPSENKPAPEELEVGHADGEAWVPAECDVSLRPGWFWHPDEEPKSVEQLMEIYLTSVGRNGLLLLNVPPDTNGRICAADSARLMEFRAARERLFGRDVAQGARFSARHHAGRRYRAANAADTAYHTYWAASTAEAQIDIVFDTAAAFDIIVLQEYLPLGQRVRRVRAEAEGGSGLSPVGGGEGELCTTVGYKRIVRLADLPGWEPGTQLHTRHLRLHFEADAPPMINRIALYNSQQ